MGQPRVTQKDEKAILRAYQEGFSIEAVCKLLGIGKLAVRRTLERLGQPKHKPAPPRRFSEAAEQQIADDYARGVDVRRLAQKYRCAHSTIRAAVSRCGGKLRPAGWPPPPPEVKARARFLEEHRREQTSWQGMIQRCTNRKVRGYADYGGRGIKVCSRWLLSFDNFLRDMGRRPPGHSLDRIDNNGDYEPGNCRWATAAMQQANTRASRKITFLGETKTLAEWAARHAIRPGTLALRLDRLGWSIERALTAPVRRQARV